MPRNSPMSAPAMNPPGFAERSTTPFGSSRSSVASTSSSSTRTSSDEDVGAAARLVEHEPGDAVVIARELPVAPVALPDCADPASGPSSRLRGARTSQTLPMRRPYTVSINIAPPCPPPMHSVAMPCLTPSRFIALTRCSTMRLPLAPTGWPSPIAPPSTLSLSRSMRPAAPVETQRLAAERLVLPGGEAGQHLRRERLVDLPQPDVAEREAVPAQDRGRAQHRAEPHDRGVERRPFAVDDHRARRAARAASPPVPDARMTHEAPSVICELLPAVTLPHGRSNAGLSLASVSTVVSGRTPSS